MKRLIVVGGPMGVGKTAVCEALRRLLSRNVFLDGDWCWMTRPFIVTPETKEMALSNIASLLGAFLRCGEIENVIFCWVLHEDGIWREIAARLPLEGVDVRRFTLMCGEAALRARLCADIAAGTRDPDVIPRALYRLQTCEKLTGSVRVDTDGRSALDVARDIAARVRG